MKEILNKYKEEGLIYSQKHPSLPLEIFNYSDKTTWEGVWDEVTLLARALVIDTDTGEVVARPFKKFFNLSEGRTNVTESYDIYEKLDGSLILAFYYKDQWIVASRGSFTSDQAVKAQEFFKPNLLDKENTYCFELLYKENRIVVDYDYEGLVLTGVFNTNSGEEVIISGVTDYREARKFNFNTPLKELHTLIQDNEEGYVIRFSNGERGKIKGAEYLRLHKAMSEMSTTAIWECLMNGVSVTKKLKNYPDEWFHLVRMYEQKLLNKYRITEDEILRQYAFLDKEVDDKTFAFSIKDLEFKHFFFAIRNGKCIGEKIWRWIKPKYERI